MDGKLLVLCDELPNINQKPSIKDSSYLKNVNQDYSDDEDCIFICWDSIIPEDRTFLEACKYYTATLKMPPIDFPNSMKGSVDPTHGNVHTSIQEQSYYETYQYVLQCLKNTKEKSEDVLAEAKEIGIKFPLLANQKFFEDLSLLFESNRIVRILPTYSIKTDPKITDYRAKMLETWQHQNNFMERKSYAKVVAPMTYTEFEEIYKRYNNELLEMQLMPLFDNNDVGQDVVL